MKEAIKISNFRCVLRNRIMACLGAMFIIALFAGQAWAVEIKTGNLDFRVRFDNTLTYSVVNRLSDQDPAIIADPNTDDGDRNFDPGLVMNRLDLLSEFDAVYNKFGVRFSGAAWYDTVYNTKNDNDSPGTYNPVSVENDEFTDETVKWHGRNAELLEAFTFGAVDMGNMTLRYRAGQFSQWWGDSFFLGWNGVAGALAPVNVSKAATMPNVQLKELIMPIPQISASLQVIDNLSFAGYYQFKWKPARLFATGSYWSPADLIGPGAERIIAGPGVNFWKTDDVEASDSGQFGVNAKLETMLISYGFYYNRFHAKDFYVVTGLEMQHPPGAPEGVVDLMPSYYYFLYPEDIDSYAASANYSVGQFTFASEVTYRQNVPFQSEITVFPDFIPGMPHEPVYPTGDTLSLLLNTFSGGMRGNFFCDSQDLIAEVAYVKQMSIEKEELLAEGYDEDGLAAKVAYTPKWYQVFSGLDLTLPLGVQYAFKGKPTTLLWGMTTHKGGDFNIGVGGTYLGVWEFELTYRNFFGDIDYQAHADRDYVSFYIRRAF